MYIHPQWDFFICFHFQNWCNANSRLEGFQKLNEQQYLGSQGFHAVDELAKTRENYLSKNIFFQLSNLQKITEVELSI